MISPHLNLTRTLAAAAAVVLGVSLLAAAPAQAGEADDLQRMVETHKGSVNDLERLDASGLLRDETTLARVWLDEAWKFRSEQEYDKVREIMDRVSAQEEMIRQRLDALRAQQETAAREAQLKKSRENVEKAKAAIQQLTIEKKALELNK